MIIYDVKNVIPDTESGQNDTIIELKNGQRIYVKYDVCIYVGVSCESGNICVFLEI